MGILPLAASYENHPVDGAGWLSSLGLSRPALSFSLSLKLSPLMLMVIE
ncbi:MAG: hypothetical protein WA005_06665 [Candidatus Binataceae bacterium]